MGCLFQTEFLYVKTKELISYDGRDLLLRFGDVAKVELDADDADRRGILPFSEHKQPEPSLLRSGSLTRTFTF